MGSGRLLAVAFQDVMDVSPGLPFSAVDSFGVLAVLWLIVAHEYPTIVAARYWAASAGLTAAGIAAFVLLPRSHVTLALALGDGLIVLAAALAWAGIRRYLRRSLAYVGTSGMVVAAVVGVVISSVVADAVTVRTLAWSVSYGAIMLLAGIELLRGKKPTRALGTYFAGWSLVACAAFAAIRIALVASGRSEVVVAFGAAIQAPRTLQAMFAGAMAWNFALVLVTIEQLQGELAQLAATDSLTGAANRRSFLERAELERARALRSGRAFAVLMMDIDRFKSINDAHGHAAGDAVLKAFVATVLRCLRPSDLFSRYGGEEFCALLPDTSASAAVAVAERICVAVRSAEFSGCDGVILPTVSIGIAEYDSTVDIEQVISRADDALYLAKKAGRNQVVVSPAPDPLASLLDR